VGALPAIWQLQDAYDEESFLEEGLHDRLEKQLPKYRPLLNAIRGYESFARSLQDAFDVLKAEAARPDDQGLSSLELRPTRTSSAASAISITDLKQLTVLSEKWLSRTSPFRTSSSRDFRRSQNRWRELSARVRCVSTT
jgi:hypothetical protein